MRNFSEIDIDDENEDLGTREAAALYQFLDEEGGIVGLLKRNGASDDIWPKDVQFYAYAAEAALSNLESAIETWAAERGVRY